MSRIKEVKAFQFVNNCGDVLTLLGVEHFNNPTDPQLQSLYYWRQEWCRLSLGRRRIVLLEGDVRNNLPPTEQEALIARGEMAMLSVWGDLTGIALDSLERPREWQITNLLKKGNSPEAVFYYYVSRMIPQACRASAWNFIDMEAYLPQVVELYNKQSRQSKPRTTEELLRLHKRFFPKIPFNPHDMEFFVQQTQGHLIKAAKNPIQQVAVDCHEDRQNFFAARPTDLMQHGVSVLGIFGYPHFAKVTKKLETTSLDRLNNTFWKPRREQMVNVGNGYLPADLFKAAAT